MAGGKINRITLFKIPKEEDQEKLLSYYREMPNKAVKDGKPYIISVNAGRAKKDQRSQGYTISVITVFQSEADMVYYDNECAAHQNLRTFVRTIHEGMMMVYFENEL